MARKTDTSNVIHELRALLEEHDLPPKLMPDTVTHYHFDRATGDFDVTLKRETSAKFAGISVRFEPAISGTVTKGAIRGLKGVKAKQGLWFPVTGLRASGDRIGFEVGPIRKQLPRAEFS